MHELRNKIGVVYGISVIAIGTLFGCSKSEPDSSTPRSSSPPPEPQNISAAHPNDQAASAPSPRINLGVVNISVEKTNWFTIGPGKSCGITAASNRRMQGQVELSVLMFTTNSSAGPVPQVTAETLQISLMPDRENIFPAGETLIAITPVFKTAAAQ